MNKRILCPIVIGIFFNFLSSIRDILKKGVVRILLVPALALLSTGVWSSASAATYNVRTDGSDSCNGSANAPSSSAPNCAFKTVQKAASTAAAGDKVIIQAGTYSGAVTFSKSGTASAPIVFTGTGSTVIKGNVYIRGNYTTVDGVTVSPPSSGGEHIAVGFYGQHNTLRKCLVTNYGAQPQDQAVAVSFDSRSAYNTIENCTIRDLNDIDVFHVFGHDQTIRNNYITNIKQLRYDLNHTDVLQTWGFSGGSANNIVFESNLITNSPCQLGNGAYSGIANVRDWTFRNNVIANVGSALFWGVPNTSFYNNVFYKVGPANAYPISLYNSGNYSTANTKFINNAFVGNGQDINIHDSMPSGLTITNNYFAQANYAAKTNNRQMGTNYINGGDPKFVNVSGLDFHTQTGSVLIGKGTNLSSSFNTDKDGNTRSTAWDIGSYQYKTGSAGSTGTLAAPSNLRIVP